MERGVLSSNWTSECILAASFLAFIAFLFLTGFVTLIAPFVGIFFGFMFSIHQAKVSAAALIAVSIILALIGGFV